MKKFFYLGALALTAASIAANAALAWTNFKIGVGANLQTQTGNNCVLYGLYKSGQVPAQPHCHDCQHNHYQPAPHGHYQPAPVYQPAPQPTYAPQPAYHPAPQPVYQPAPQTYQPAPHQPAPQTYQPAPAPQYPPPVANQHPGTAEPPAYGTPGHTQSRFRTPAYPYYPSYAPRGYPR